MRSRAQRVLVRSGRGLGACLPAALATVAAAHAASAPSECDIREEGITAALSTQIIEMTSRFTGEEVLLYGTIDCPADVIVVVRGPREHVTVRRKTRVAGIWINSDSVVFENAPEFYAVAASGSLDELLPQSVRRALDIGVEQLNLRSDGTPGAAVELYRDALIGDRQKRALYGSAPAAIPLLGGQLFRGSLWFPATVRTGVYRVDVYYVRDRTIIGTYTMPLWVEKVGFEAMVYDFAHRHPSGYGLAAIAATVLVGLSIASLLRKT
jgi:uncharacterized protein (TIGR02186 family)